MHYQQRIQRLEDLPGEMEKAGNQYATAKAQSEYMDNMKKVVLAAEMGKLDPKLPMTEKERRALDSEEYRTHLNALRIAEEAKGRAQAAFIARQAENENARSITSLEKSLVNLS